MTAPPDHDDDELHGYRGLIPVLESFDKPLLAAVNGLALGIGATILPHCDIVWIAEDARLKVPFVTLGVTTEAAGSLLLPAADGLAGRGALHLHRRLDERGGGGRVRPGVEGAAQPISCSTRSMAVARTIGGMPRRLAPDDQAPHGRRPRRRRPRRTRARGRRVRPHGRQPSQPSKPSPSSSAEPTPNPSPTPAAMLGHGRVRRRAQPRGLWSPGPPRTCGHSHGGTANPAACGCQVHHMYLAPRPRGDGNPAACGRQVHRTYRGATGRVVDWGWACR